jgi:hypothetical protein
MCELRCLLAKTVITVVDILGTQYPHVQVWGGGSWVAPRLS